MEKALNILFVSEWYPHRYDAMAGLFVRKHAEAVARDARVCVLFPFPDKNVNTFEIVEQKFNAVTEIYVYFPYRENKTRQFNYFRAYIKGLKYVFRHYGKPDVTHANVFTKTALVGYVLKKLYHIPYVVTEHWSGYFPANGNFKKSGKIHQFLTRFLAKKAACVMPVSGQLQQSMLQHGIKANYRIVPNVVDDFFYESLTELPHPKKRILHISCFDERAKNISGILRATKAVSKIRQDFELIIVGTGIDFEQIYNYAQTLLFPDGLVQFIGEQTPNQVCNWFYQSDFFLLFSNYENAPVVISESLATGTPVLSSDVGGIPEMITNKTGQKVLAGDETALAKQLNWMLDHFQEFDREEIRKTGKNYSYEKVENTLQYIYRNALACLK